MATSATSGSPVSESEQVISMKMPNNLRELTPNGGLRGRSAYDSAGPPTDRT